MPTETLTPLWFEGSPAPRRPPLEGDAAFDVVVVGAGLTGLTAGLLLAREGKRTAVVDMHRVADGETGHTTAHLTELFDFSYRDLHARFGLEGARLAGQSARAAIRRIEQFCLEETIDCQFRHVPVFLYTEKKSDVAGLHREVEAARKAGVAAVFSQTAPVPFATAGALMVPHQADFDARAYILGLARSFEAAGGTIFEVTQVTDVADGAPCRVTTKQGVLRARDVIVAANAPINNLLFLQTKVAAYRTYAMSGSPGAVGLAPGLYWDTEDPYHYVRTFQDGARSRVIVGGEDHKTGQGDPEASLQRLEQYAREKWGLTSVDHRWSGQVLEPVDGLAYIGRNSGSKHVFVATGFSGTGMTFGTVAGMMLSDEILERPNVWAKLYEATRVKPSAGAKEFISENVDFPVHFLKDRLKPATAQALQDVPVGEGRIVEIHGQKLAVCHSEPGKFCAVSPVCTHMKCFVQWNNAEKSWDCPCHGARFDPQGRVLNGPARENLEPRPLE